MRRLTAQMLLLLALAGSFLPLAMAASAASVHACCLRKSTHHCHASSQSQELAIGSRGCCPQGCNRGVTTSKSARPGNAPAVVYSHLADRRAPLSSFSSPTAIFVSLLSGRGPPAVSIA
jgi:hypothetical protein